MSTSAGVLEAAFSAPRFRAEAVAAPRARIALLGTGTVGRAVLERLASWANTPLGDRLQLVHMANSRVAVSDEEGVCARQATFAFAGANALPASERLVTLGRSDHTVVTAALGTRGCRIILDATASESVAEQHAHWLAHGIHVVTACKLGQGTSLARWRSIRDAAEAGAHYGDSATVGAG